MDWKGEIWAQQGVSPMDRDLRNHKEHDGRCKGTAQPEQNANALKHGVYSGKSILPGEDPKEFDAQLKSLFDEWQPNGPSEEETVRSLADYLWRKNRLDIFARQQHAKAVLDENWELMRPILDEAEKYTDKPDEFRKRLLSGDLQHAVLRLAPVFGDEVLPSPDILEKRARAVRTVCDALGLKKLKGGLLPESVQTAELVFAETLTPESFEEELAVRERLDGMIDRCIKRLIHLKVGKRLVELDSRPKMLPKPNGNPRPKLRSV
jgi:hypothetical protein